VHAFLRAGSTLEGIPFARRVQTQGRENGDAISDETRDDEARSTEAERESDAYSHSKSESLFPTSISRVFQLKEEFSLHLNSFFPARASEVDLTYSKPDADTVNLTCSVAGVYPEPEVKLTWGPL